MKVRSIISNLPELMTKTRSRAGGDRATVERLTRTFRALGDPARSRMVLALSQEERCVSELAEIAGLSLSATSHQLRILRDLDLVMVRRAGRNHLYTLNEHALGFCSPRSCQAWRRALAGEKRCR